jgi:hypothetical protein
VREFIVDREHDPAVLLKDGRRLDASVNYLRRLQLELDPES